MQIIASFITNLILFIAGMIIGARIVMKAVNQRPKKNDRSDVLPVCFAEYLEGSYYLYAENSNKFLCQSPTIEGLAKNLRENKKIDIAFVIAKGGDHEMFWFAGGEARPADLAGLQALSSEAK